MPSSASIPSTQPDDVELWDNLNNDLIPIPPVFDTIVDDSRAHLAAALVAIIRRRQAHHLLITMGTTPLNVQPAIVLLQSTQASIVITDDMVPSSDTGGLLADQDPSGPASDSNDVSSHEGEADETRESSASS
ncbi:hypothetical protein VTL71DRAFT_3707 [Oculimacula yallundae]|uniref:Uncharacterized protein n=1 Tax=Oculimacula yallundae TaxID=86028 RepID=A0ABR4C4G7_9HELO